MLYYSAINSTTLELLRKLLAVEEFAKLRLVGGTSLALQIGHRLSVDLDLFGQIETDSIRISQILSSLGESHLINKTSNILVYTVNGIKVDIVNYPYPWIEETFWQDDIPLASQKDIAAMKMAAITGRGSKKDFIDVYFLLQKFSLKKLLDFYNKKFSDGSSFLVLKSLSYFDDAEKEPDPIMLIQTNWEEIKKYLTKTLSAFLNSEQ